MMMVVVKMMIIMTIMMLDYEDSNVRDGGSVHPVLQRVNESITDVSCHLNVLLISTITIAVAV